MDALTYFLVNLGFWDILLVTGGFLFGISTGFWVWGAFKKKAAAGATWVGELQSELAEVREDWDEEKNKFRTREKGLKKSLKEKEIEVASGRAALDENKEKLVKAQTDRDQLQSTFAERLENEEHRNMELKFSSNKVEELFAQREEELSLLRKEAGQFEAKISQLEKEVEDANQQDSAASKKASQVGQKARELEKEAKELKKELKEKEGVEKELEQELLKTVGMEEEQRLKAAELSQELQAAKQKIVRLNREVARLRLGKKK